METTATKRIEALYQIRGDEDVFAFIEQHPFLVPLLMEAQPQIKTYFPESKLSLEMFVDPEGVGVRSLLIVITSRLDVDLAYQKLIELEDQWWLKYMPDARNKLGIYLEMVG